MKKIISIILICFVGFSVYFFNASPLPTSHFRGGESAQEQSKAKLGATPSPEGGGSGRGPQVKIIAIGDSLTAGYGLTLDESYPKQLKKKLLENNYNVEIINAGVSGETTAGLLERVDFIKKQNPEIILITIGGNDALRALPVSESEKNILKIIQEFKKTISPEKIFLLQIQAPENLGSNYVSKFNSMYGKIAKDEKIKLLPFVDPVIFTNEKLMQNDGIHPNADGYQVLIDKYIYSQVVKVLK